MRQSHRGIADLSRLLAEDRAEESLLGGELGLSLGSHLTDEYVAGTDLSTLADDAVGGEILESVLADVRNLAGDLLRSELGVARLVRVLLDVDRGVDVVADELFIKKNSVLVVVALPGHEADESVLTERNFAVRGSGTVRDDLLCLDALAEVDYGLLVYAGALVGALELDKVVDILGAGVGADDDLVGADSLDEARVLRADNDSGVDSRLVLHTGGDDRLLRDEQRHSLLLHVRSHQSARVVVVLEERNVRGSDRHDHLRRSASAVHLSARRRLRCPCRLAWRGCLQRHQRQWPPRCGRFTTMRPSASRSFRPDSSARTPSRRQASRMTRCWRRRS